MTTAADALAAPIQTVNPQPHVAAPQVIDLLRDLIMAYTHHHRDLKIDGASMGGSIALGIRSNLDDYGRLVGAAGGNIWALTVIFGRIGDRMRQPIRVSLFKSKVGLEEPRQPFAPDPDFRHGPTTALFRRVLAMSLRQPCGLSVADVIDSTHYEINPDPVDRADVQGDFIRAIRNIFAAIGKNRGRTVVVHLAGMSEEDERREEQHAEALRMSPAINHPATMTDHDREMERELRDRTR
jgi:predicted RNA-binding protein YlqC (UPF0109 family)